MSLESRITRLEYEMWRAELEPIALKYGVNLHEAIAYCYRFIAMSDAEQDIELAAELAEAEAHGDAESLRILREGWEVLKSSRSA
jgi:hypothetical protein